MIDRHSTKSVLDAWIKGEKDAEAVWRWAEEAHAGQSYEDDLVRDIVEVLATLPQDLITEEEAEVMSYGLGNAPEEADLAQNLLWNHIDGIDTEERRRRLSDHPLYGPYCAGVE